LNYGFDFSLCQKAVDAIEADALILHLNPLQEALMESGDTRFSGLLTQIEAVCRRVSVPVIIKEVGWGIDWKTAEKLFQAGAAAIDVAGAGGTSWSEVEMHRTQDSLRKKIAAGFRGWGMPTADSIEEIRRHDQTNLVFASGGLADGIDVVKCLALGANLCGIARPFLKAASESAQALDEYILSIKGQVKIAMFAIGARDIANISKVMIERT
jgi:isopentenyl-diphosphate delta-isomerase